MPVTNVFAFSHNVFYPLEDQIKTFEPLLICCPSAFIMMESKIELFGKELTLYHTIPAINDPARDAFRKREKKIKGCNQHFLLFPTMFSILFFLERKSSIILETLNLLSANDIKLI